MAINYGSFNHILSHVSPNPTTTIPSQRRSYSFKSKTSVPHYLGVWSSKIHRNITKLKFKLNPRISSCGKSMKVSDFSFQSPYDRKMRKLKGLHMEDIQRKVSMLQKTLNDQETVHEILQQVHEREDSSRLSIPSPLTPKMKELLDELAMVDNEIFQLESQILELQSQVQAEQEVTKESESKQLVTANDNFIISNKNNIQAQTYSPAVTKTQSKRIGMFKSLNGKINLENEKGLRFVQCSRVTSPTASPCRDVRHPALKTKDRNKVDLPRKSLSISHEESGSQMPKSEANKLSENIVKCLVHIYARLKKTWRQVELEKGGHLSRSSMNSPLCLRSEDGDDRVVLKESSQQDPYGIFKIESSIRRDVGPYKNLLVFGSSSLNPKCISTSNSLPLFQKLRELLNRLQKMDVRHMTEKQKLAFWINIYNACIMNGYLVYGAPSTPEVWLAMINKATINVGGTVVNAQEIEHCILRKSPSFISKEIDGKYFREAGIRELYRVQSLNPNAIFALSTGSRSSPAVRVYTAEGVMTELERSKIEYLQASITVTTTKKILIPELLLQNSYEFAKDLNSLVKWVYHQLPTSGSLRKTMADCFRKHSSATVDKFPHEPEFQYLLPA